MNIIERIKALFRSFFPKNEIIRITGVKPQISADMVQALKGWRAMYDGEASWCRDYVKSLQIERGICREFSDVILSEMTVNITNDNLQALYDEGVEMLNSNLQSGLALGSFVIKPLETGETEYITADNFVPLSFGLNGEPDDILFIQIRQTDDSEYYIRVERHTLSPSGLTITNKAYKSSDASEFGRQVSLTAVPEWAELAEETLYPGMQAMDYGYFRTPIKNNIDGSTLGVSVYDSAIDAIRRADIQAARLEWEYESGERAIHVDSQALKTRPDGHNGVSKLNKRLYKGLNLDDENKPLFDVYSPDFRDDSIIQGLERYYRQIEFSVGLAYGDLSNAQDVEKTATEIKNAKFRKYNRVAGLEKSLEKCLREYIDALAFYQDLYRTGYEVTINFKDSILTDEETERQTMRQDLSMGILQPWEYRARWYGEDEETAKAMVNQPDKDIIE